MSNYYQEELNSESSKSSSYDSDEGHSLGISTLDYEKIDTQYQKNKKRSHEVSETSENSDAKKIKTSNVQDQAENKKEKNKDKNVVDEDDPLFSCPICLEPFLNKTLLNPCFRMYSLLFYKFSYIILLFNLIFNCKFQMLILKFQNFN